MKPKTRNGKPKTPNRVVPHAVVSQPDIRETARANGALVEAHRNRKGEVPEGMEMAAFMAVFHPNIKGKKLKALVG
jgi:hypothetical protein